MTTLEQRRAARQRRLRNPREEQLTSLATEAVDPSLLQGLGTAGLNALAGIGAILDLPGSTARDFLGGENPLDQWIDPFNLDKRLSGRDLLRQSGMIGRDDNWSNFAGGLAAEVALDPLWLLGGGISAATKAGGFAAKQGISKGAVAAAKKIAEHTGSGANIYGRRTAGMELSLDELIENLPKGGRQTPEAIRKLAGEEAGRLGMSVEDLLGQKLSGGSIGYRVPWTDIRGPLPIGETAQRKLSAGLDITGDYLSKSLVGRRIAQKFDYGAKGTSAPRDQELARGVTGREGETLYATQEVAQQLDEIFKEGSDSFGPLAPMANPPGSIPPPGMQQRLQGDILTSDRLAAMKEGPEAIAAFERDVKDSMIAHAAETTTSDPMSLQGAKNAVDLFNNGVATPGQLEGIRDTVNKMAKVKEDAFQEFLDVGGDSKYWDHEMFHHLPRYGHMGTPTHGQFVKHYEKAVDLLAKFEGKTVDQLDKKVTKDIWKRIVASPPDIVDKGRDVGKRRAPAIAFLARNVIDIGAIDPAIRHGSVDTAVNWIMGNGKNPQIVDLGGTYKEHIENGLRELIGTPPPGRPDRMTTLADFGKTKPGSPRIAVAPTDDVIREKAEEFVRYIRKHGRRPIFGTGSTVPSLKEYVRRTKNGTSGLLEIHNIYGKYASVTDEGMLLREAFAAAKMEPSAAIKHFAKHSDLGPAELRDLGKMRVPDDVVRAANGFADTFDRPAQYQRSLMKVMDAILGSYRGTLTLPFPAFHSRNLTSGQTINLASGHINTWDDVKAYASEVLTGRKPDPLDEAMSRTNTLSQERGAARRGVTGATPLTTGMKKTGLPGVKQLAELAELGGASRTLAQDVSVQSMGPMTDLLSRNKYTNLAGQPIDMVLKAGAGAMEIVEDINRIPMFRYLVKHKHWDPVAAAKEVEKLQFDYGKLTDFEKTYMKRGFLFYTFSRKVAPLIVDNIVQRPGGLQSQMMRAAASGQGEVDEPIPDYLRGQTIVPLGKTPTDDVSILSGFGSHFEDWTRMFPKAPGKGAIQGTTGQLLARSSPFIQIPYEIASGLSASMPGRRMDSLDPKLGRLSQNVNQLLTGVQQPYGLARPFGEDFIGRGAANALERVAAGGPWARAIPGSDPRKLTPALGGTSEGFFGKGVVPEMLINNLTGMRITQVSPTVQDSVRREQSVKAMRNLGGRVFAKPFFPKDVKERASKSDLMQMLQLEAIMADLAMRSKARAEQNR